MDQDQSTETKQQNKLLSFLALFKRQTSGSIPCAFCGQSVEIKATKCPHCDRQYPALGGYARLVRRLGEDLGFVSIVTWGCLALYLSTLLFNIKEIGGNSPLNFLSPDGYSLFIFGSTGAIPIFQFGRWWTIVSSAWLHGSLMHIGFNLAWVHYLAPGVAKAYGGSRLMIIYTVASVTGSVFTSLVGQYGDSWPQFLHGADLSVGASGGIFGLLGALVSYGQIAKKEKVKETAGKYALVCFLLGFILPGTDNWGHFGGFVGGYGISRLSGFNPYSRPGYWHLIGAVTCWGIVILSVTTSIIHGLFLLQ